MSTVKVSNTVLGSNGAPIIGADAVVTLVSPPAFTAAASVAAVQQATTDSTGTWLLYLTPNAQITNPANTVYLVSEQQGQTVLSTYWILVPNGAGPYLVPNITTSNPVTTTDTGYLTSAQISAVNGLGSNPQGSDTSAAVRLGHMDAGRRNMAPLRRWHKQWSAVRQATADGTAATTDVVWIGDSISEGWFGNSTTDMTASAMVRRFQRLLGAAGHAGGKVGRWVPAGNGWWATPKFSANDTSTETGNGLSLRARQMPNGAAEAVLVDTTDRINVHWRQVNIFAAGDILIRAYSVSSTVTTTTTGTQVLAGLTTLNVTDATSFAASGAVIVTDGVSPAIVTYAGKTSNTLTGCSTSNSSYTAAAGTTVAQATSVASNQLQGFNGALAANAQSLQVWDSGALTRGVYAVGVQQVNRSSFTGPCYFDGAYLFDGDYTTGARVWNASRYGSLFSTFHSSYNPTLNAGYLSAIQQGIVVPSLVVIALGTNNGGYDPIDFDTQIQQCAADVTAACTAAGTPTPSFALMVPPSNQSKSDTQWETIREQYITTARAAGYALWDWSEITGPVSTMSGDPFGWSVDNTHPGKPGQRMLGDFAAKKAMEHTAESDAAETLMLAQPSTIKGNKTTALGLAADLSMTDVRALLGTSAVVRKTRATSSGSVACASSTWIDFTAGTTSGAAMSTGQYDLVIPGLLAGDWVGLSISGAWSTEAIQGFLSFIATASSRSVTMNATETNTDSPGQWYGQATAQTAISGEMLYQVQSGDLVSGVATFRPRIRSASAATKTVFATFAIPLFFAARRL